MGAPVNNVEYTGAGYGFNGKKRSMASDSQDCAKPDLLTMKDGPTYALSGMDDTTLDTM